MTRSQRSKGGMPKWEAFILYDPVTSQRIGIYVSEQEAKEDCWHWRDEGYAISPCEITLVKRKRGRLKSSKK